MKRIVLVVGTVLTAAQAAVAPAWDLSGTSRTSLRASWADAASGRDDRGAYGSELLVLEADQLPLESRGFFSGSFRWDLGQEESDSVFYSSVDRFPNGRQLFVYDLGLEVRPADAMEATVGRFAWESAEPVHLDGGAARLTSKGLPFLGSLSLEGFGGRLVQYYEDLEKDGVWGGAAEAELPGGLVVRADFLGYFDDLTRVSLRHAFRDLAWTRATAEWVNGDLREAEASVTLWWDPTHTQVTASAYKKVGNEQDDDFLLDFTADADPGRYQIERLNLERQAPYQQYRLAVEQALGSHVTVSGAYTKRDLIDEDHYEDPSNTSFDVVQAGLGLYDPGVAGLTLRAAMSWWREDRLSGHEARSLSYSLAVEQEFLRSFTVSAAYYRKDEDINNDLENLVAGSLELGLGYRSHSSWSVDLSYRGETDDLIDDLYGVDEIHTVGTRVTVRF
ncbi:MAG: hypothetical protein Kow0092_36820 [Deferrisomatales bacterium]